jgi:hypothetical protein
VVPGARIGEVVVGEIAPAGAIKEALVRVDDRQARVKDWLRVQRQPAITHHETVVLACTYMFYLIELRSDQENSTHFRTKVQLG